MKFSPHSIKKGIYWSADVLWSSLYRFYWDDCFSRAAALAYTSLFALVPVTALGFSVFVGFGFSDTELHLTLMTILEQLMPKGGNAQIAELRMQLVTHLEGFILNVRALNIFSVGVLIFTSVALLNTIESALNIVWRVTSNQSLLGKIANFWTALTLGPIFILLSIFLTAKMRLNGIIGDSIFIAYFTPALASWVGLTLLYYKLPAARVRLWEATVGAGFAAILFEGVKAGFTTYISLSTTYTTVYGVIAIIPLFLFWLYIAWVVILLGAEVSYQAGAIHVLSGLRRYATQMGAIGVILGLQILIEIAKNFAAGKPPPTESDLAIRSGSDPVLVRACLDTLTKSEILTPIDEKFHSRALLVSAQSLTVEKILQVFCPTRNAQEGEQHILALLHALALHDKGKLIGQVTLEELLRDS